MPDGGGWSTPRPGPFTPGKTHCTGGWVGPRAGLDGWGKSHPNGIRSPDRPFRNESLYRPFLGRREGVDKLSHQVSGSVTVAFRQGFEAESSSIQSRSTEHPNLAFGATAKTSATTKTIVTKPETQEY